MAEQGLDIIKCLILWLTMPRTLQIMLSITWLSILMLQKVISFYLSDIKTLRSNGEEQTITEITAVQTDRELERRDIHSEESKLQICLERVRQIVRDKEIVNVTTMIPESFQPWLAQKDALVRQITYLSISNPGAIFFSCPTGKVWYVRQTKPASLHLFAEITNVKTPRSRALFSNDRFLVCCWSKL